MTSAISCSIIFRELEVRLTGLQFPGSSFCLFWRLEWQWLPFSLQIPLPFPMTFYSFFFHLNVIWMDLQDADLRKRTRKEMHKESHQESVSQSISSVRISQCKKVCTLHYWFHTLHTSKKCLILLIHACSSHGFSHRLIPACSLSLCHYHALVLVNWVQNIPGHFLHRCMWVGKEEHCTGEGA